MIPLFISLYILYNMAKTRRNKKPKQEKKQGSQKTLRIHKIPQNLFKKYKRLSPFELKNNLMTLAKGKNPSLVLNAGRGNPNFFNSFVRLVFARLQTACVKLSTPFLHDLDIFPRPNDMNYEKALRKEASSWPQREREFFDSYLLYIRKRANALPSTTPNHLFHDVVISTLGCFYPSPPVIQPHLGPISRDYLHDLVLNRDLAAGTELPGMKMKPDDFDTFATEGAAAGILYVFNTLRNNSLLKKGDNIAIITPIFSPYLEMPVLTDPGGYGLNIIRLKGDPSDGFSLPDTEIEKLKDKSIKALFMVNPENPGAYSLSKKNIVKIGDIVNTERKDLIVLSDNVYAPFAPKYYSFMMSCPRNTIEVFSLSKFFGTTGWRLGLVMIAKDNRINEMIKKLPKRDKDRLHDRYSIASMTPNDIPFMERLVLDSRQVAEGHVGGLSTPQQTLIGLFLFYYMNDKKHRYITEIQTELKRRMVSLYSSLKTSPHITPLATDYYNLMHIPEVTENLFGKKARDYLEKNYEYMEFLFHLAKYYHIILLPGEGFGADEWRVRVSLANLENDDYTKISIGINQCIKDFVRPML